MIQMSLEFELEMAEIPLEYERVFVSFLKAACSGYSCLLYTSDAADEL